MTTRTNKTLRIASLPGDGIGREILPPALMLVEMLQKRLGGFDIKVEERLDCGAAYFKDVGWVRALTEHAIRAVV